MTPYIGEIRMFAGNFPPVGWMFCDGALLPIQTYDTLFTLIGTTYGGDGKETFALPDLRGRLPIHTGQGSGLSSRIIGESAGQETVTLVPGHLPIHNHAVNASSDTASATSASGNVLAATDSGNPIYRSAVAGASTLGASVGNAGAAQPHDNLMPYLVVSFIICIEGIFPPRN